MNLSNFMYSPYFDDRRQNNTPVDNDRRSYTDRREAKRVSVDPKLSKDIFEVKNTVNFFANPKKDNNKKENPAITALRFFPPTRKLMSAYQTMNTNWLYSAGMIFRFWNEAQEDIADLSDAIKGNDTMKDYQHPFWAFRGSLIDQKAELFKDYDIMLYDIQSVQKFLFKIGLKDVKRKGHFLKFEGNPIAKVIARATYRMPLMGAGFFALLESYNVAKAENKPKEALKAAIRIICVMSLSALGGAAGGYHGKKAELVCMGAGIIAGTKVSSKIDSMF